MLLTAHKLASVVNHQGEKVDSAGLVHSVDERIGFHLGRFDTEVFDSGALHKHCKVSRVMPVHYLLSHHDEVVCTPKLTL
jgi:hypothetical protein